MITLQNLHKHLITIYVRKKETNQFVKSLKLGETENFNYPDFDITSLYAIECFKCNKILDDFNSNFYFDKFYPRNRVSLFCSRDYKNEYNYNNVTVFKFIELNNIILLGTKSEIIFHICKEFNTIKNDYFLIKKEKDILNSQKLNKEKSLNEMESKLKNEKKEKEEMKNKIDNIQKEKNVISDNFEKEKNRTNELNSKINKLTTEQINLKKKVENLDSKLKSEKANNKELNTKLDQISFENNANIKKVLEQVEQEKSINKNLDNKISELKRKEQMQKGLNDELEKSIKEKEKLIKNLKGNNENLGLNINELKKNLNMRENEFKKVKDSLIKEKDINKNISQDLNSEKEKNKKLNEKLDNIAIKNSENVNKVLQQFDEVKKKNQNLENKYIELEKKNKIEIVQKQELKSELQKKDEELKKVIENYIPENYGLKFKSDCKTGEYDIIIDINSIRNIIKNGWKVYYNGKEGKQKYLEKKEKKTVVVGVIGNKNMGKTFFLEKLTKYNIPDGFDVTTKGLSCRYSSSEQGNVAILDSAGQETPLLRMDDPIDEEKNENINDSINNIEKKEEKKEKNEQKKSEEDIEKEQNIEFENYSRDKLITEFFLQKFIIWKSDIIILVIGNISLTEQKLLLELKDEIKNSKEKKHLFVVHNLKEFSTDEQVKKYIEKTLKKLCKIDIEETQQIDLSKEDKNLNNKFFNIYFTEKNANVTHFIFVNEFSNIAEYYNIPTIKQIQKYIESIQKRNKFSLIEDCKQFFVQISEDIIAEGTMNIENFVTEEGENEDRIILKNMKEINLKSYMINEVGKTFKDKSEEPNHSCYIDTERSKLYITLELPGGAKITRDIRVNSNYYIFSFEGEKPRDQQLIDDENGDIKKLITIANQRSNNKFKFDLKVSCGKIQLLLEKGQELGEAGKLIKKKKEKEDEYEDSKGVYTYEYDVLMIDQKRDKNNKNEEEL